VISIGNLRVGGSGKTPATACIARLLLARGERPVILSRGYARQRSTAGVTVVSDRSRVLTDVAHAGDEPFLLARTLPGVPVLVCANRYQAGLEAESRFAASVHLLDDGFQHVKLARDIDLLLVDSDDLTDRVLPAGRLREPLSNASIAHAVITPGTNRELARSIATRLGVADAFTMTRGLGAAVSLSDTGMPGSDGPVFAVAGIARPERFFDDLRAAGFSVCGTQRFPDHHPFTPLDIDRIVDKARTAGAAGVVTTEKDAVRLPPMSGVSLPFAAVPLLASIEPTEEFGTWLAERLVRARDGRSTARP
jgi:tetraacyldisaccharide 4'-kinase